MKLPAYDCHLPRVHNHEKNDNNEEGSYDCVVQFRSTESEERYRYK